MMDSKNALEIRNVSKTFHTKVDSGSGRKGILGRVSKETRSKEVLKDVSFDIKKGEVVGILGRNGCGKSTLLKMIAKIMDPDSGSIEVSGKVASILELGMGFHPDMSGRENIYLKGELYGFTREDIDSRIDEIISYSGLGDSIDNPVRTYSSGMSGRLAFSIMVNVEADIMLVDEVLSTGDSAFSAKASEHFKKMARSGKTILFVSHTIGTIEGMCARVIWIEDGLVRRDGPAKNVCAEYNLAMSESPEIMLDLAEAGVSDSQFKLARAYRDGIILEKNDELYEYWLEKASSQGHVVAQVEYADLLFSKSDDESLERAMMLYQSAAAKGNMDARMKVSSLCNEGLRKDILELRSVYKNRIDQGDNVVEFRCADLILKTAWDADDREEAFRIFKMSADHGNPGAMYQTAIMYRDGVGTPRDLKMMVDYLEKASLLGHVASIVTLADMYRNGSVIAKDDKKSFDLYKKGALMGNGLCMYQVAVMLRDGIGVETDVTESEKWFSLYSQSGIILYYVLVPTYLDKDATYCDNLNKYLSKAVDFGNTQSMSSMMYLSDELFVDLEKSYLFKRLLFMAECGNNDAIKRIANMYYDGVGVSRDYSEAVKWYLKSVELGDSWSKLRLADIYRSGKYQKASVADAIPLYVELMRTGNIQAISTIISMVVSGEYKDLELYDEAMSILTIMAESGNVEAMKKIGSFYYDGVGVSRDYSEAVKWYEHAALLGDQFSKNKVADIYKNNFYDYENAQKWFVR